MRFLVTIRFGGKRVRYHQTTVEAEGLGEALRAVADGLPEEVAREADLAELRPEPNPDDRGLRPPPAGPAREGAE